MNVAIAQFQASNDLDFNIKRISDISRSALDQDVDILCFTEWFAGQKPFLDVYNQLTSQMTLDSKRGQMTIVTGTFVLSSTLEKTTHSAAVIDDRGEIIGVQDKLFLYKNERTIVTPGKSLEPFSVKWGNICILSGLTSLDVNSHEQAMRKKADIIIMQYSFRSEDERQQIEEMVLDLSKMSAPTIVVASHLGPVGKSSYIGRGFIVHKGETLVQGVGAEELILANIDQSPIPSP